MGYLMNAYSSVYTLYVRLFYYYCIFSYVYVRNIPLHNESVLGNQKTKAKYSIYYNQHNENEDDDDDNNKEMAYFFFWRKKNIINHLDKIWTFDNFIIIIGGSIFFFLRFLFSDFSFGDAYCVSNTLAYNTITGRTLPYKSFFFLGHTSEHIHTHRTQPYSFVSASDYIMNLLARIFGWKIAESECCKHLT